MSHQHAKILLFLLLLSGCVYDDRSDCPQGINVEVYSQTACRPDTIYPEQIQDLTLFVFDTNGTLVSYQQNEPIQLQKGRQQAVKASNGLFTVLAWAGLNAGLYDLDLQNITTRQDILFRLKRVAEQALSIEGNTIYYGESPAVFLPDPKDAGSVFEHTAINMQEITNRITVSVEGLPNAENYEINIESRNASMNVDGSIASDEKINYASKTEVKAGVLESKFTLLKLSTGYNSTIVIKSKQDGQELYRGDLLGTLLLKNPDVNLACDHDFTIRFTTKDQCKCGTYTIMEIWVNNWLVHSYETDL
ncbi:MAG: FimB/Mfa2 family fimbrial subunit [Candidatus Symbiothrix sp.]|jgi:hypothetical protein|nr:FimB/Mfa2 family fimbrial subunit [Candidatus Symbiothrix sp.]